MRSLVLVYGRVAGLRTEDLRRFGFYLFFFLENYFSHSCSIFSLPLSLSFSLSFSLSHSPSLSLLSLSHPPRSSRDPADALPARRPLGRGRRRAPPRAGRAGSHRRRTRVGPRGAAARRAAVRAARRGETAAVFARAVQCAAGAVCRYARAHSLAIGSVFFLQSISHTHTFCVHPACESVFILVDASTSHFLLSSHYPFIH